MHRSALARALFSIAVTAAVVIGVCMVLRWLVGLHR
jgi:hypothetical protein